MQGGVALSGYFPQRTPGSFMGRRGGHRDLSVNDDIIEIESVPL